MDDLKWCLKIISIVVVTLLYVSIWWAMPYGVNCWKRHPDNNGWNFIYLMYKLWVIGHIIAILLAFIMILIGALSVPVEWDATFFLFTLIVGGYLFFAKRNWIVL